MRGVIAGVQLIPSLMTLLDLVTFIGTMRELR